MIYGYVRVSTDKQDEGRQEEALVKSTTDRPELPKMLLAMKYEKVSGLVLQRTKESEEKTWSRFGSCL